jgi:hypothetical protein
VYRLASGKLQSKTTLSTLRPQNGTYTSDTVSTIKHMMEHFVPEDNESSDCAHNRFIRQLTVQPLDTLDDEEFTEETQAVLKKFDPGKAPR